MNNLIIDGNIINNTYISSVNISTPPDYAGLISLAYGIFNDLTITNNTIIEANGSAICLITSENEYINNAIIKNNRIVDCGLRCSIEQYNNAISCKNVNRLKILDNLFEYNRSVKPLKYLIYLEENYEDCKILGNQVDCKFDDTITYGATCTKQQMNLCYFDITKVIIDFPAYQHLVKDYPEHILYKKKTYVGALPEKTLNCGDIVLGSNSLDIIKDTYNNKYVAYTGFLFNDKVIIEFPPEFNMSYFEDGMGCCIKCTKNKYGSDQPIYIGKVVEHEVTPTSMVPLTDATTSTATYNYTGGEKVTINYSV